MSWSSLTRRYPGIQYVALVVALYVVELVVIPAPHTKAIKVESRHPHLHPVARAVLTDFPSLVTTKVQNVATTQSRNAATTPTVIQPSVTPAQLASWSKVNVCEEGGNWHVQGEMFSGGLGISNANWIAFGGTEFAPDAADATPAEQIIVAERIEPSPPDQDGCSGSW